MIRYRWWVIAIWTVLFLAGAYATSGLSDLLTNRFTLPVAHRTPVGQAVVIVVRGTP